MERTSSHPRGRRALALAIGLVTHAVFVAGVASMALSLAGGMRAGRLHLEGWRALLVNGLLVLQFPLLHSVFLGRRGGAWLARRVPAGLGQELSTTTYALFAGAQLVVTFALWSPSGRELWRPHGALLGAWTVAYAGSWLLLGKAMSDARLALQTGFPGWSSVWRGVPVRYGDFPQAGLFRRCRQPVYLSFAVILWCGPVWTVDHLALALAWTAYCLVGPRFKERRYLARHGEAFARYQADVPYWLPLPLPLPRRTRSSPPGWPS